MNNSYQLYLKLSRSEDGIMIKQLLQKVGFINFKKTGANIDSFRNFYFQIPETPSQLELHFRILPNETKISTIAIKLFFSCPAATLKVLFTHLSLLEKTLPFQLLDLELRDSNYSKLHKNKTLQESTAIPSSEQQNNIEKTAYIPISFDEFILNKIQVDKRQRFFIEENNSGEKAPDDMAAKPRAKGN